MRVLLAPVICVLAGCTTFEDPSIVLDLRIIAMTATDSDEFIPGDTSISSSRGPEQVIDVDFERPNVTEILAQLRPTTISAVVADPGAQRDLVWSMTLCILDLAQRCDLAYARIELGSGVISDPDDSLAIQRPTADIIPDQKLLAILREAVEANPVQALGGIEYGVVLTVSDLVDPSIAVHGAKHLRVAGRFPPDRTANTNPFINYLDAAIGGIGILIPRCRCALVETNNCDVPVVDAGSVITLFPVEPESVREVYVAPTLTAGSERLTETIRYQWLAAHGSFSDETTGGGHDVLGNQSLLGTEWRAPRGVTEPLDVPIWMVQRDERYGANLLETCIRVVPP